MAATSAANIAEALASSAHETPRDRARILKRADAPEHGVPEDHERTRQPAHKVRGALDTLYSAT
jgi:hypothetical protein